jgi:hypothetical protein
LDWRWILKVLYIYENATLSVCSVVPIIEVLHPSAEGEVGCHITPQRHNVLLKGQRGKAISHIMHKREAV